MQSLKQLVLEMSNTDTDSRTFSDENRII